MRWWGPRSRGAAARTRAKNAWIARHAWLAAHTRRMRTERRRRARGPSDQVASKTWPRWSTAQICFGRPSGVEALSKRQKANAICPVLANTTFSDEKRSGGPLSRRGVAGPSVEIALQFGSHERGQGCALAWRLPPPEPRALRDGRRRRASANAGQAPRGAGPAPGCRPSSGKLASSQRSLSEGPPSAASLEVLALAAEIAG
jgi:hypothetical protein